MAHEVHDVIGVGFGPGNIAIAVAFEEMGYAGSILFLERAEGPGWQEGMLLEGSDTQHNPLRDFATPRNPQSRFGFLTYLHEHGRLFDYLNLGVHYPLRTDYAIYIRWVAHQFDDIVRYGKDVVSIEILNSSPIELYQVKTKDGETFLSRSVIFAPGRTPYIPRVFRGHKSNKIVHFGHYRTALEQLARSDTRVRVAVIGASQSAIEIILDTISNFPQADVVNIQRGFGFQLKDTSPFTEHAYFPEFVDLFHGASLEKQRRLRLDLRRSNYGSADFDVIQELYVKLYQQKLTGRQAVQIITQSNVESVFSTGPKIVLSIRNTIDERLCEVEADLVILATGFLNFGDGEDEELFPNLLSGIASQVARREDGSFRVGRDYRLAGESTLPPIFLNGLNESTHGFGDAGSFSLLSLRSWTIASAVADALASSVHGAPQKVPLAAL